VTDPPGVSFQEALVPTRHRVGDPDPRPDRTDATPCCDASDPDGWGFICTMEPGHEGDHVAGTGATVAEVWPQQGRRTD